jgi:hypothetical protein
VVFRLRHTVFCLLLTFVAVVMAFAQARAQGDTVCVGQTSVWTVEEEPGVSYTWELYNDVTGINFVTVPGNCPTTSAFFVGGVNTGPSVEVMCLEVGTFFIKVTATDTCTNNLKVGKIEAVACESYASFLDPDPVCAGDTAMLTVVVEGGPGPWDITYTDGVNVWTILQLETSPHTFPLIPTPTDPGTYQYWITSVSNSLGIINNTPGDPVTLTVYPVPVTSPIYKYDPTAKK